MEKYITDIAIIGGGASGLAAAIAAAECKSVSVTVFERLPRVGKKILSTGNGRCNLSNEKKSHNCYNGDTKFLSYICNVPDAKEFFLKLGLLTKTDTDGRIYPHSMAASSVLDALRHKAEASGVKLICDCRIDGIAKNGNVFVLTAEEKTYYAESVIISTGGKAAPSLGSDGDGYSFAKSFGHTVTKLYPALAPLRTDINKVKALKGLRAAAKASLLIDGKCAAVQKGEVQFSDGALSGICIFNLSALAAENIGHCEISLDLAPEYDNQALYNILSSVKALRSHLPCEELLTGLFHKRIGQQILKTAGIRFDTPCSSIDQESIKKITGIIKDMRFPVTGVSDWSLAQTTSGGIPVDEINDNFKSAIVDGLFFCGEILNICGQCGGYNLDWAWKSGITAGEAAARCLNGGKNA
ncbi:MAG: aminoacetone oxidase family FAD-binding enzyme [Eubacterium sp.]|nr:aminoacetone oxidase family FAD-binding enzyme [Eubacterium sp.]